MASRQYRYLIDSTKATAARYPGPFDVLMDSARDEAITLCPHHAEPVDGAAFSYAPTVQRALEYYPDLVVDLTAALEFMRRLKAARLPEGQRAELIVRIARTEATLALLES